MHDRHQQNGDRGRVNDAGDRRECHADHHKRSDGDKERVGTPVFEKTREAQVKDRRCAELKLFLLAGASR